MLGFKARAEPKQSSQRLKDDLRDTLWLDVVVDAVVQVDVRLEYFHLHGHQSLLHIEPGKKNIMLGPLIINIARIANAVHCHS